MSNTHSNKEYKSLKIKANDDIEINGHVYFISDKYLGSGNIISMPYETRKLYKIMFALYLDLQISTHKIEDITKITKKHIEDTITIIDKLICYITTGKLHIMNLTVIEKIIIDRVPESLLQKINPLIIEKIEI